MAKDGGGRVTELPARDYLRAAIRPGITDEHAEHLINLVVAEEGASRMVCGVCESPVGWINSPTGGWWAHADHPHDGHDALPRPADEEVGR